MHVHDEAVIEEPCTSSATVESVCRLMATPPAWAEGLPLDADGYECSYYKEGLADGPKLCLFPTIRRAEPTEGDNVVRWEFP